MKVEQFNQNGFDFILAEDHSVPNASIGINFNRGAVDDDSGKDGLTQLTMEMLLRGTKDRCRAEITEGIDYLGANLTTSAGLVSSGIAGETLTRFLEPYMEVFGDILLQPTFPEEELEKLKKETIDLLELSLNNDMSLGRRQLRKAIYADHPYGRAIDGTVKSLKSLTVDDVCNCYQNLVRRGNMTIYAAGDISKSALMALSDQYFGKVADGGHPPAEITPPQPHPGRHLIIVDKPDRSQIQLYFGQLTIPANHPDFFALNLANTAFGGSQQSRYTKEIRIKRGWTYHASSNLSLSRDAGIFYLISFTSLKNLTDMTRRSLEMLTELEQQGFTQEELEPAKSNLINQFPFKIDTAEKRLQQQLHIRALRMPPDYLESYCKKTAAVSLERANTAIRRQLQNNGVTIVAVCEATACRKDLEMAIDSLDSVQIVPYDETITY